MEALNVLDIITIATDCGMVVTIILSILYVIIMEIDLRKNYVDREGD